MMTTDRRNTLSIQAILVAAFLLTIAFTPTSHAAIKDVTFHLSGLLCNQCAREIRTSLMAHDGVKSVEIDALEGTAHIVPKKDTVLDLYDINKELRDRRRHASYVPWKVIVTVSGKLSRFTQHYENDPHTHVRHALKTSKTDQIFVLLENEHLDALISEAKEGEEVTVTGQVPTFDGNFPLLVLMPQDDKALTADNNARDRQGSQSR